MTERFVTVEGFLEKNSLPYQGMVEFTPSKRFFLESGEEYAPKVVPVINGVFSVDLLSTDDGASGWFYRVQWKFGAFTFLLPPVNKVNFADLYRERTFAEVNSEIQSFKLVLDDLTADIYDPDRGMVPVTRKITTNTNEGLLGGSDLRQDVNLQLDFSVVSRHQDFDWDQAVSIVEEA